MLQDETCIANHLGERAPREEDPSGTQAADTAAAADAPTAASEEASTAAAQAAEPAAQPSALEAFLEGGANPLAMSRCVIESKGRQCRTTDPGTDTEIRAFLSAKFAMHRAAAILQVQLTCSTADWPISGRHAALRLCGLI